jgi:hypothetical protein
MEGRPTGASLLIAGDIPKDLFEPEKIAALVRVVLPAETDGLSDTQVVARAKLRGYVMPGGLVISTGQENEVDTSVADVNIKSAKGSRAYRRALLGQPGFYRLDVEINGTSGIITYEPKRQAHDVDGNAFEVAARIGLMMGDPKQAWAPATIRFLQDHHPEPLVAQTDTERLAALISETSRKIAEPQGPALTL